MILVSMTPVLVTIEKTETETETETEHSTRIIL